MHVAVRRSSNEGRASANGRMIIYRRHTGNDVTMVTSARLQIDLMSAFSKYDCPINALSISEASSFLEKPFQAALPFASDNLSSVRLVDFETGSQNVILD